MELRKSKFTFQTWKDKKIPKPKGLDSWNDNPLMNKNEYDFYTLNHWSNRGLLSDSEHQKIKSEKRKAYYKALKLNVQIEFDAFMEDCSHTPPEEMNDVIRLEMELTERKLANHRMIQAIKQGKDASHLINPGLYNEIQNEKYVFISFSFFEAHQSYEYLQMLKKLDQSSKASITRKAILLKAHQLKDDGMQDMPVYEEIKKWLFDDLKFTNEELKRRFGFELHDHEDRHKTFSRFVNNHPPHSLKE